MANGGNLLEDVGTIIAPNISGRLQKLNDRRQERGALDQLLNLNPPSPTDRQDLSVGTNAPGSVMADLIKPPERFQQETQDYRAQALPLAKRLAPEAFAQSILEGLLPKPPTPIGKLGKGDRYYGAIDPKTGQAPVLAEGMTDAPEGFKVGATREIQRGPNKVFQEFDGQKWNEIGSGPAFAPREAKEPSAPTTRTQKLPDGTAQDQQWNPAASKWEPIGQPYSVKDPSQPNSFKDAEAGADSVEGALNQMEGTIFGTPAEYDKTGKLIKPAVRGVGTELTGEKAGELATDYGAFVAGIKQLETMGTYDNGTAELIGKMLTDPSSWGATKTSNDFIKGQFTAARRYLKRQREAKRKAYGVVPQTGGASGGWSAVEVK